MQRKALIFMLAILIIMLCIIASFEYSRINGSCQEIEINQETPKNNGIGMNDFFLLNLLIENYHTTIIG